MAIGYYLFFSSLMLGILGLAWNRSNWPNFSMKMLLLSLSGFGLFQYFVWAGWMVKK